jgi:hypothetical protein
VRRLIVALATSLLVVIGALYAEPLPAPRPDAPPGPAATAPRADDPQASPTPTSPEPIAGAPRLRAFHGTVADAVTREPLGGVEIEVCEGQRAGQEPCEDRIVQVETEKDGSFFVDLDADEEDADGGTDQSADRSGDQSADRDEEPAAPEKPVVARALVAKAEGYARLVAVGEQLHQAAGPGLLLLLQPGARLKGRVLLPSGERASYTAITWTRPGEPVSWAESLGRESEYEFEELPAGEIVVTAHLRDRSRGWRAGTGRVWLVAGETRELDVLLDVSTFLVRGRLVDAAGRPVAQASLEPAAVQPEAGGVEGFLAWSRKDAFIDGNGDFELEYPDPGPHPLRFLLGWRGVEEVIATDSLPGVRSGADGSAAEQIVRATRPDLVGCSLLTAEGSPVRITRHAVSSPVGLRTAGAVCGCGAGGPRLAVVHFLWPPEGGPVDVKLADDSSGGQVVLGSPNERCEVTAQLRRRRD